MPSIARAYQNSCVTTRQLNTSNAKGYNGTSVLCTSMSLNISLYVLCCTNIRTKSVQVSINAGYAYTHQHTLRCKLNVRINWSQSAPAQVSFTHTRTDWWRDLLFQSSAIATVERIHTQYSKLLLSRSAWSNHISRVKLFQAMNNCSGNPVSWKHFAFYIDWLVTKIVDFYCNIWTNDSCHPCIDPRSSRKITQFIRENGFSTSFYIKVKKLARNIPAKIDHRRQTEPPNRRNAFIVRRVLNRIPTPITVRRKIAVGTDQRNKQATEANMGGITRKSNYSVGHRQATDSTVGSKISTQFEEYVCVTTLILFIQQYALCVFALAVFRCVYHQHRTSPKRRRSHCRQPMFQWM